LSPEVINSVSFQFQAAFQRDCIEKRLKKLASFKREKYYEEMLSTSDAI